MTTLLQDGGETCLLNDVNCCSCSVLQGGALLASEIDWDRIEVALTRPSHVDAALVNDLETINSNYWSLFMAASPKSTVLSGVPGQLKMPLQFFQEEHDTRTHQTLCALASST